QPLRCPGSGVDDGDAPANGAAAVYLQGQARRALPVVRHDNQLRPAGARRRPELAARQCRGHHAGPGLSGVYPVEPRQRGPQAGAIHCLDGADPVPTHPRLHGADDDPLGHRLAAGVVAGNELSLERFAPHRDFDAGMYTHGGVTMSAVAVRRWQWVALITFLVVATAGCDPITMSYFLFSGFDTGLPAEKPIANSKKEVKVLILTTGASEWRPMELMGADRELTGLVAHHLTEQCKQNKERVTVVSAARWRHFKDEYPNWKSLSSEEIGKYFEADYVLDLEVNALT